MKKIIVIALVAFASAFSVISCSEETVAPNNVSPSTGGGSTAQGKL